MNYFATTPQFTSKPFAGFYVALKVLGYGDLNFDALWKWSALMEARESILDFEKHRQTIKSIDIGGGYSPIHHWCSMTEQITNVDRNFNDGWFDAKNKMYVGAPETPTNPSNITYVEQSYEQYAQSVPDESIDRCYDGCSIIHFRKTNELKRHNDGCAICADHIYRILKPGGFFIMVSDTCAPECKSTTPEWLTAEQIVECFTGSGFKQYGPINFSTEGLFTYPSNDGNTLTLSLHTFQKPQCKM